MRGKEKGGGKEARKGGSQEKREKLQCTFIIKTSRAPPCTPGRSVRTLTREAGAGHRDLHARESRRKRAQAQTACPAHRASPPRQGPEGTSDRPARPEPPAQRRPLRLRARTCLTARSLSDQVLELCSGSTRR